VIRGLDELLAGHSQPGLAELRSLLTTLLDDGDVDVSLVEQEMLQPRSSRVFRLRFDVDGHARRLIVKRLSPEIARRTELIEKRWLPAVGMTEHGPALLGHVAERGGHCVWHVYDDLGRCELDASSIDRERVSAAIELIARLHTRFARHPLLGEVRLHGGGDLGIHFCEANVRDATYALAGCRPAPRHTELHDRLLQRLDDLRRELPRRRRALDELGGPETLLHGDLWAINVFVIPTPNGLHARLIDWDHAAVGPASYDLSTFLLRLPSSERLWILDLYRDQTSRAGWRLPSTHELNGLFETAERARIANRIIWPAIAVAQDDAPWGWHALAEVDQWFEDLEPVLPCENRVQAATS
jgi:hypothetical protein